MCHGHCYWGTRTRANKIAWASVLLIALMGLGFWVPGVVLTRGCLVRFYTCDREITDHNSDAAVDAALACVQGYKHCVLMPAVIWGVGWVLLVLSWAPCAFFCCCSKGPHAPATSPSARSYTSHLGSPFASARPGASPYHSSGGGAKGSPRQHGSPRSPPRSPRRAPRQLQMQQLDAKLSRVAAGSGGGGGGKEGAAAAATAAAALQAVVVHGGARSPKAGGGRTPYRSHSAGGGGNGGGSGGACNGAAGSGGGTHSGRHCSADGGGSSRGAGGARLGSGGTRSAGTPGSPLRHQQLQQSGQPRGSPLAKQGGGHL